MSLYISVADALEAERCYSRGRHWLVGVRHQLWSSENVLAYVSVRKCSMPTEASMLALAIAD